MGRYIDNMGIVDKAWDLRQSREYRSGSRGSITSNGLRIFQASGVVGCKVRASECARLSTVRAASLTVSGLVVSCMVSISNVASLTVSPP